MLDTLLPFLILAAVIGLAIYSALNSKGGFSAPETKEFNPKIFNNYTKRPSLFVNRSEEVLFDMLYKAFGKDYRVFSKVRLEDIIGVRAAIDGQAKWALRGRVKSRHVDFLITTRTGKPLMIIELDGSSHGNKKANLPDAFKDGLARKVGLPLKRIKVGHDFRKAIKEIESEIKLTA